MGSVSLVPGLAGLLGRSTEMLGVVGDAAERIADEVRDLVPVGATGALQESIRVEIAVGPEGVFAKVLAGDERAFYAGWVEFGTEHSPPNPYLTGGAEAAGYKVIGGKET